MLPARRQGWRMSPHTSSVRRPTPSKPRVRPRRKVRRRAPAGSNASGSANSCRRRFANSYSTTSGSETTSAGRCSTADGRNGLSALPNMRFVPTPQARHTDAARRTAQPHTTHVYARNAHPVPNHSAAKRCLPLAPGPDCHFIVEGSRRYDLSNTHLRATRRWQVSGFSVLHRSNRSREVR